MNLNESNLNLNMHSINNSTQVLTTTTTICMKKNKFKWYNPGEHRKIIKNVILISLAFQILFTAFLGMSNLQSSLHTEGGLGVYAMSLTHVFVVISAIFLPTFIIQKFTVKFTIVYAMIGYTTFLCAQFYPTVWTLIPSAIIVGICAAPLWAAKCTYISKIGHLYADIMDLNPEEIIIRFFGIFFLSFQSSLIWGNLISSVVLSSPNNNNNNNNDGDDDVIKNNTNLNLNISLICGKDFCPSYGIDDKVISKPPQSQVYILAGIYLILNLVAAILVTIFVDPLSRFDEREHGSNTKSTKITIIATIQQMLKLPQILLIPLTFWSGLNLGFYFADFSQAFVACTLGVESIGYIGIAFGTCDAILSIGFGIIVKYLGRIVVFTFGAIINLIIIILLFNWKLDSNDYIFLIIISGMWGISDAIWQTQINGLYGVLFKNDSEAAFSNYRLWESLGFIISFLNSNLLCIHIKLYILFGVLCVGMCGYYIVEYLERLKIKK